MSPEEVEFVAAYADVLQIGARNAQNFSLLKKVGKTNKPVFLKRGMSTYIQEFLMAAEYILSEGNPNVILCERGIRTFETATRFTLDLNAVPVLKEKPSCPRSWTRATAPATGGMSRRWRWRALQRALTG